MQPNDTIDDYQIYEDLGRGGFATVKRAVRKRDNMEVAIKMVSCLLTKRGCFWTVVLSCLVQQSADQCLFFTHSLVPD